MRRLASVGCATQDGNVAATICLDAAASPYLSNNQNKNLPMTNRNIDIPNIYTSWEDRVGW